MSNELVNPTFERWLQYVFNHPVKKPEWYWENDAEFYQDLKNPQQTVDYLTRFFESPTEHTQPYSDEQINQGLWMLISDSQDTMYAMFDNNILFDTRGYLIECMFNVFEQLFFPRCSPHQVHMLYSGSDKTDLNPLNRVCYMWWDIIPLYGKSGVYGREGLDKHCLDVMEKTLKLDSIACQESALHGLGHWEHAYPKRIHKIIDKFLSRKNIDTGLISYARAAREGYVQ